MEIIVLLAIASVVAALTVPAVMQANRLERVRQTWTILERTRLALYNTTAGVAAFRQGVAANAGRVSELTIQPVLGDPNSCGNNLTNAQRNTNWPLWGPFGGFTMVAAVGLPTPIGLGNNTLVRNPAGGGGATGTLAIVFPNTDVEDASLLDQVFDNADGLAAGVITWTAPAAGLTTMSYLITIDGTC